MNTQKNTTPFIEVKNLTVHYTSEGKEIHAVNDVSFSLQKGETLGLVGETGAGKTTIAKSILRILPEPPAQVDSGRILLEGKDLLPLSNDEMRKIRGKRISMIFQDPMTALNPVMRVGAQIAEGITLHEHLSKKDAEEKAKKMLEMVGIPGSRYRDYPHQFSGGMKQRVVIAMALACSPDLLLADEPTTALDVTIQAQILELMQDLQKKLGMAIIMVTHDLGVIASMCDEILVMYGGRVCERGTADDIFYRPAHEYTKGLLRSIPKADNMNEKLVPIGGTPINLLQMPAGCAFCPRCDAAMKICLSEKPEELRISDTHLASCWMNIKELYEAQEEAE